MTPSVLSLDFAALRAANIARIPTFKNGKGEPAHAQPDGSDWCLAQWCNAVTGELGELANLIKKVERGDFPFEDVQEDIGKELADVVTYLDILAMRCGIDLGKATISKFNEVSERVDSPVRLFRDGHSVVTKRVDLERPTPEYMDAEEATNLQNALRNYHRAVTTRVYSNIREAADTLQSCVRSKQGQYIVSSILGYC